MTFQLPTDLVYNRERIDDPTGYARQRGVQSWLYINGEEFAAMPGGMSYQQVQQAVPHCARVVSDPPRVLDLELARQHVAALDALPRPTLVSCRAGPRASAVAYMYAGLKAGASAHDVLAAAVRDGAPFCAFADYQDWVRDAIETLRDTPAA